MRRYRRRAGDWDVTLARLRAPRRTPAIVSLTSHARTVHAAWHLRLRTAFTLHFAATERLRGVVAPPALVPPLPRRPDGVRARPDAADLSGLASRHEMRASVRRIAALPSRAESRTTPAMPITTRRVPVAVRDRLRFVRAVAPWAETTPPTRVLARPAAGAEHRATSAGIRAASAWSETPAPRSVAPAIDVGRLTDEVIRALDQRVVAARERFGRA